MSENKPISLGPESQETPAPEPPSPEMQAAMAPSPQAEIAEQSNTVNSHEEDVQMLDVHPPHEPIHSWKTYLLHMSTIVLGLLIAIGLEQSVEAVHRSNERKELRESLQRESEKARLDAEQSEHAEGDPLRWLTARTRQVENALNSRQPLTAQLPRKPHVTSNLPIDPAWNAAKSSGLLSLLTQEEIQAYSEADLLFTGLQRAQDEGHAASYKRAEFEVRHATDPDHPAMIDLSHATPEELNTYITLLMEEYSAWDQYRVGCEYLRGIETAILSGDRDLGSIQKASRQFYSASPR